MVRCRNTDSIECGVCTFCNYSCRSPRYATHMVLWPRSSHKNQIWLCRRLPGVLNWQKVISHCRRASSYLKSTLAFSMYMCLMTICYCGVMLQCKYGVALQAFRACQDLVDRDLGYIVEACEAAVPVLVGYLRDWADPGVFILHAQLPQLQCESWRKRAVLHTHAYLLMLPTVK